ncbi:MAG: hypothetical protein JRG81_16030 [Deltaproteobacteria bacterium]|nr:hypothetical protein [Deltaproteobacteria bacterium]
MTRCKKCGKTGLFHRIEKDTGLCLSCNEDFAREGKDLTEKIVRAKKSAAEAKEPASIREKSKEVGRYGSYLIELHKRYNLEPSQELLDLIETYEDKR